LARSTPLQAIASALRLTLSIAILSILSLPVQAEGKRGFQKPRWQRKSRAEQTTQEKAEPTVRLSYLSAKWSKVLSDVAEAFDKTLVADRVPSGHFSRSDRQKHNAESALKILNREMAKKHFRVVIKGDFLVVLDKESVRPKYRPAVVSAREKVLQKSDEPERNQKSGNIQQAGHQESPQNQRQNSSLETTTRKRAKSAQIDSVAIQPGRHSAVGIARMIYRGFKPSSRLIDEGPAGLPGFLITHEVIQQTAHSETPRKTPLKLAVGIDADKNELIVEGPTEQVESLLDLVEDLDSRKQRRGENVQLIAGKSDVGEVKRTLQPVLNHLQLAQADVDQEQPAQDPPQEAQPGTEPGEETEPDLQSLIGGLKGDVAIEAVPGSGVLIIRGNEADTAAAMRIIEEIQRLSKGVAPDIEVRMLRNVRSTALAELLTTLYEKLTGSREQAAQTQQPIVVLPIVTPNAVLILAPSNDMKSVLKLTDELDQPVAPDTQFQVIRLKSAVATQVVEVVNEFYAERGGLAPQVKISADARTNAVMLHAGPRDMQEISSLIAEIDREDSASVNQMRFFRLNNAVADELAEILNTAVQSVLNPQATTGQGGQFAQNQGGQAGGEGAQEIRGIRSTILQFLKVEGNVERVLRSGILADIRITAEPRTNTLMVTAPESSMPLMEELIRQLDQPSATVAEIKVFKLFNADAAAIVQILDTLFSTGEQDQQVGVQVVGANDASSNLIPPQFTADVRTNSVIARGGAEALRVAEAVLYRLDADRIRERETIVYRLKNNGSDDVAAAINEYLTRRQDVETQTTDLGSLTAQLEREVIVVSEPNNNNLIISATPRYSEDIKKLVADLDTAPKEVMIQALIVEVELNNTDEFGVEMGFQDSLLFDRSIITDSDITKIIQTFNDPSTGIVTETESIISQASTPGFPFNNQPLGNNTVHPAGVGTQGLSHFAVDRVNGDLGFGGLVLAASSESVSVLIRALQECRHVEVLSRPQIRTLDNMPGSVIVGQEVPVTNGVNITAIGNAFPTIEQREAGIRLQVIPRITPDGRVIIEVLAERSAYDLSPGSGVPIFADVSSGNVIEAPVKNLSSATATISAKSGQTIVLGGMITNSNTNVERKVPFLGDIPVLGHAFRYHLDQHRRTELLIFLTPRIVHDDATSEWIKQVESERIHFYAEEAESIHGPIFALPEERIEDATEGGKETLLLPSFQGSYDEEGIPTTQMPSKTQQAGSTSDEEGRPRLLPVRDENEPAPLLIDDEFSDGPTFE